MTNRQNRHSRRDFIGLTGAGFAGAVAGGGLGVASATAASPDAQDADADLVVLNAKVYTIDSRLPRVEAFAVKADRFVAVGTTADIRGLVGKSTRTFDARQMTIVPGFTDCHNHAGGDVLLFEVLVGNPFEVEFVTIGSIVEKMGNGQVGGAAKIAYGPGDGSGAAASVSGPVPTF